MNLAARKLSVWLVDQKVKKGEFAERIRVGLPTVSRLLKGQRTPSLDLADRIFDETNEFVTPKDWLTPVQEECGAGQAA